MGWAEEADAWKDWAAEKWDATKQSAWDTVVASYGELVEADPTGALKAAEQFIRYVFGDDHNKGATHLVGDILAHEQALPEADVQAARLAAVEAFRGRFDAESLPHRVDDLAGPLMKSCTDGSCGFVPLVVAGFMLGIPALAWCYAHVTHAQAAYEEAVFYREELQLRAEAMKSGKQLPAATPRSSPASGGGGGGSSMMMIGGLAVILGGAWWLSQREK